MLAVTVDQMIAAEKAAIHNGCTEAELMLHAGTALGHAIGRQFPQPGTAVGYLGKGHNAGDTLIALRILQDHYKWNVFYRNAFPIDQCAALVQQHAASLDINALLSDPPDLPCPKQPVILLDGLLGTGSKGPIRPPLLALSQEMQSLRKDSGARIAAIDLPSGIDPNSGEAFPGCVTADITFMIANAKLGLLSGNAVAHTGALALVPVPVLSAEGNGELAMIAPQTMNFGKAPLPHDMHKGNAGTVRILAGSESYSGAAVLAAIGALRGGAGMVILHVPRTIHGLIAAKCPPEIIVQAYDRIADIPTEPASTRVAGCGLGPIDADNAAAFFNWLRHSDAPTVIDADGLNLISSHHQHSLLTSNHVVTPHPGEFRRLAPELIGQNREQAARCFTQGHPAVLLLKGARSIITQNQQPIYCNSTGHAGMATAGQGDLLAGVIGSQLAAGHSPLHAAILSAWLCGRAAEIALNQAHLSQESLTPSDVAHHLGAAHRDWKSGLR